VPVVRRNDWVSNRSKPAPARISGRSRRDDGLAITWVYGRPAASKAAIAGLGSNARRIPNAQL
jgi:hypothetical protein